MLTMRMINSRTFDVWHNFEIPKIKSIKTGLSFVSVMRLVTGLSEGKEIIA